MRKGIALALVVITALGVGGCIGRRPTQVARFRITDVKFRKLAGAPSGTLSRDGSVVNGRFLIAYERANATAVVFDWAFGQHDPDQPWHAAGSDSDLDGQYTFDTTFTSVNWVTIRGTATTPGGQVVVDQRVVNIDNRPPDVSVSPRDRSVLNSPPTAIVINVVDGGATEGTDEAGTEVSVTVDGSPLTCSRTDLEDQIQLVPQGAWPNGLYEATVTPKDITGNVGNPVSSQFTLNQAIVGSPPAISIVNPVSGTIVSGTVGITYAASPDVARIWIDYAFGQSEPLAWQEIEEDITVDGSYLLDTTFTGRNWVSIRLFAESTNGLTAVSDSIALNIQNP
ncbi:MAG: hypothetical protein ACM309_09785 [Bacillota bacterium]